ncbi:hypothetical protein ACH4ZX_03730 [Streptomyces sp. NPDC020490]|uniref:hypothetical protein n=1 Tax=Streptomyces sp. NPDC020490 TaxID=3365078 RepID=UPI0037872C1C
MTPAEEIEAAAVKLRSLVTDATEGPWHTCDPNIRWGDDRDHRLVGGGKILAKFNNGHNGPLNADYVAAMHSGVGEKLTRWLRSAARDAREIGPDPHALAVARAINGSQP